MYGVYTLWLSCYFLYHITSLSFPVCMIIHLFLPVLLLMCHVTAHNTLPFVPLLYCSVVTHIHIFPCIRILIIPLLYSDNAYRYRTHLEVRDGSGNPHRGPARIGGPSQGSGTGGGPSPEVRDRSGDPTKGSRQVE